jgi:signal transduction histidine kinase/ActR/RegA family two-component response regulator
MAFLLTCLATVYVSKTSGVIERSRFKDAVHSTTEQVRVRMDAYTGILRSVRSFFKANPKVNRQTFHTFVDQLKIQERYPGIQGVGYSIQVKPGTEAGVIAAMQREGFPDFKIWPPASSVEKHAIISLEPMNPPNRKALGFNMYSDPTRRAAMQQARDTGRTIASGSVTLVQEIYREKQRGFLIYVPFYDDRMPRNTPAQRRAAFQGFIYSPFRAGDLFKGIFGSPAQPKVGFSIYDGPTTDARHLLYRSAGSEPFNHRSPQFKETTGLQIAGHTWTFGFYTLPAFERESQKRLLPFIFVGGLFISFLLFGVTFSETQARLRSDRISDELRESEERVRFLAEASALLASSLDYPATLQRLAELTVPFLADWCVVDVLAPDGSVTRMASVHSDPRKQELARKLWPMYSPHAEGDDGLVRVLKTGEPILYSDNADEMLGTAAHDEQQREAIRELGLKSGLIVPLLARGRTLGAMALASAESNRRYTDEDVAFAEDLARRAAVAMENALLFNEVQIADRRKDEFLATLAHELRNPLAPILNALHLFRHHKCDDERLQRAGDILERQVQHVVRLVDDLLDVSRISHDRIEFRPEPVEVAFLVEQAVQTSLPLMEEKSHRLHVSLPKEPLWLMADPTRLIQVISNLLNNAAKYTEPGGEITVRATREEDEAVVSVRDNGKGIPPEMLSHIFELFTQVNPSIDRGQGGLGLGLTLVRRLVEMHGGQVEARSNGPGQGSEFRIRLPLITDVANANPAIEAPEVREPKLQISKRILVVEDNLDGAEMLAEMLKVWGHDVFLAHNGIDGFDSALRHYPDVVLLDIGLPGMDGYEVARRIRQNPGLDGALLVAVTGFGQEADRQRSEEAGFDHHFTKPLDIEALHRLIGPSSAPTEN